MTSVPEEHRHKERLDRLQDKLEKAYDDRISHGDHRGACEILDRQIEVERIRAERAKEGGR